jgi:beta-lactamase superfamily II metal-dependent hydrolase
MRERSARETKVPHLGQVLRFGEVRLRVVNTHLPRRCSRRWSSYDLNDCSLGIRLDFGEVSVLLPAAFMSPNSQLGTAGLDTSHRCTILKMPHHGVALAGLGAFLDRIGPRVAIANASARDPTPAVLALYRARGITTNSTGTNGHVVVETDGHRFHVTTAR